MPVGEGYRKQVALLIKTAPFVAAEKVSRLKVGRRSTCSSATCRGCPSNIDLTYVAVADRVTSLKEIDAGMKRIAQAVTKSLSTRVNASSPKRETGITKLIVRGDDAQIKSRRNIGMQAIPPGDRFADECGCGRDEPLYHYRCCECTIASSPEAAARSFLRKSN